MLKPLDLTVLAYLRTELRGSSWTQAQVAAGLGISQSSVHRALQQLDASALLGEDDRPLRDLLVVAVRHVYPPVLGAPTRGLVTGWSHPSIAEHIHAPTALVWPTDDGETHGLSLAPLHPSVPGTSRRSPPFHEFMALLDVFRVGKVRERTHALQCVNTLLEIA